MFANSPVRVLATPKSPILICLLVVMKTFMVLISLCNIFCLCRSLRPNMIWMANFQTVSSGNGLPICPLRYWAKSPPEQYYIQMYSFSFYTNDWKYFTMYYELIFFIILTSFMACIFILLPILASAYPLTSIRLLLWRRYRQSLCFWLCRLLRKTLSLACWLFNNLLNS